MLHKHHKIPLHAGGKDIPSNIAMLTVKEHAEAHRRLYRKHGREEDRIAWLGLSGIIGHEEAVRQAVSAANKGKRNHWYGKKRPGNIKNQLPKMWKVAWKVNRCPVMCEGRRFESVGAAERFYGTRKMVRGRLDKPEYPEFYRLRERTKRK